MQTKYLKINAGDNVAVAITTLNVGESISVNAEEISIQNEIPAGHKFALKNFDANDFMVKYCYAIGHARESIAKGGLVNEKNIKTNLDGLLEYTYNPTLEYPEIANRNLTFKGYRRKNGEVGIRNEVWIIPTVGCVNGTVNQLVDALKRETNGEGVDAIVGYPHNYGCSQLGGDHENTRKILRNLVKHPNAGAVLVVGLGCENNQLTTFREFLGDYDSERIKFIETQKVDDELEEGMDLLRDIYAEIGRAHV